MESLKRSYQTTCHTIARNSSTLQVTGDSNSPPRVPLILKPMVSVRKLYRPSSEFLRRQYIGLLENRNTPVTGMTYSPSQLLMSRATRTKIPVGTELLQPKLVTEVYQQLKACQQRQVHYYKATHNFETTGSCPSATRKNLDPSHSGCENRNAAILLSHNRDWTTISPKPRGSLADWRTSSYTISARGK